MAKTRNLPSPLFGRLPDAKQTVRDLSEDLLKTIRRTKQSVKKTPRSDFPMRFLQSVVHAHVHTDCVVGRAIPAPSCLTVQQPSDD